MPAAPTRGLAERVIISMASRSTCPVLRRPWNRTCSHWFTSRVISAWIAAAVFFPLVSTGSLPTRAADACRSSR